MIYAIEGTIVEINQNTIAITAGPLTYLVFVSRGDIFKLGETLKLYTHQVVREDEIYLVGFKTIEEREIFLRLITVKGIGPKTAIGAMSTTSAEELVTAISANNVTFLKKLPGIGAKAAAQIILDLKGQLTSGPKGDPHQYEDVREGLKQLGFRVSEIDRVLATINIVNGSSEDILKEALTRLRKTK